MNNIPASARNLASQLTSSLKFRKLLVVIKQTAYEEYSQLRLRGQAPKALRWQRLENRYKAHKTTVNDLMGILRHHNVEFTCVNRVELDRQHLAHVDLMLAVGGDGTVLSAAHFIDHGTIPLLGINSDPSKEQERDTKKKTDERRSHGALCMCTSLDMSENIEKVLAGLGKVQSRTRIQCTVKSTFTETQMAPALNDILIAHPSPAAVSRFRMGFLEPIQDDNESHLPVMEGKMNYKPSSVNESIMGCKSAHLNSSWSEFPTSSSDSTLYFDNTAKLTQQNARLFDKQYGTVTRFGGKAYDIRDSLNIWCSGMWTATATGSTAAICASGGMPMHDMCSTDIQYKIREHIYEKGQPVNKEKDNAFVHYNEQLHLRWNSQHGTIFIDGSHLTHDLVLGDEILINGRAPPLTLFVPDDK